MAFSSIAKDHNQGDAESTTQPTTARVPDPFSSIRTFTVGFGVSPNLLTPFG